MIVLKKKIDAMIGIIKEACKARDIPESFVDTHLDLIALDLPRLEEKCNRVPIEQCFWETSKVLKLKDLCFFLFRNDGKYVYSLVKKAFLKREDEE